VAALMVDASEIATFPASDKVWPGPASWSPQPAGPGERYLPN